MQQEQMFLLLLKSPEHLARRARGRVTPLHIARPVAPRQRRAAPHVRDCPQVAAPGSGSSSGSEARARARARARVEGRVRVRGRVRLPLTVPHGLGS